MEAQWEKIGPKRGGKPAVQTPNAIGPCLLAGASASEHWDWSALPALLPEPCITHLPSLSAALLGECVIFLAPPTSQGPYFKTVPPLQFNAVVHNGPFPGILTLPGLWGPQKRKKDHDLTHLVLFMSSKPWLWCYRGLWAVWTKLVFWKSSTHS